VTSPVVMSFTKLTEGYGFHGAYIAGTGFGTIFAMSAGLVTETFAVLLFPIGSYPVHAPGECHRAGYGIFSAVLGARRTYEPTMSPLAIRESPLDRRLAGSSIATGGQIAGEEE
jgi:hypothetical protein